LAQPDGGPDRGGVRRDEDHGIAIFQDGAQGKDRLWLRRFNRRTRQYRPGDDEPGKARSGCGDEGGAPSPENAVRPSKKDRAVPTVNELV
jgi:hypothetical protein